MKKLLFILPILLSFSAYAQFGPQTPITNFNSASNFAAQQKLFDLDNDGDLDLLGGYKDDLYWTENLGSGIFYNQRYIASGNDIGEVIDAADIDGDGDLDVITANGYRIEWYENFGGNFGSKKVITSVGPYASWVIYTSDIDNDGDIDIVSGSLTNNIVEWYENQGNGTFLSPQLIAVPYSVLTIITTDLDGDGDQDVVFGGGAKVLWNENLGNGTFGVVNTLASNLNGVNSLFPADINGDGKMDLLCTSELDSNIVLFTNFGFGNFSQQIIDKSRWINSVCAADIDNDGDMDIFTASKGEHMVAKYENLGAGVLGPKQVILQYEVAAQAKYIFAKDIDGDADIDLFLGSGLSWFENLGAGILNSYKRISPSLLGLNEGITCDLDNDGDIDVLTTSKEDHKVSWFENLGAGNFDINKTISSSVYQASHLFASDIDNDGDKDIIARGTSDIYWFENLGGGIIDTVKNNISTILTQGYLDVVDIDNDNDEDILVTCSPNKVILFENLGSGIIDTNQQVITSALSGIGTVKGCDLDNDGDIDLLCVWGGNITWLKNTGSGYVGQSIITNNGIGYTIDIDNDGDWDLICSNSTTPGDGISWVENLGAGNFGTEQLISSNVDDLTSIYALDIDLDGDLDVFSGSHNDDKIAWYENLGGGVFSTQNIIATNTPGNPFVFGGDIDGDGGVDLLTVSGAIFAVPKLVWYENYIAKPKLKGLVFFDANQNGQLETTEKGMSYSQLFVQPQNIYSFSNDSGYFSFAVSSGSYLLGYSPLQNWTLTSDSMTFHPTLTTAYEVKDSLNFGFYPTTPVTSINPDLVGAFPRCNQQVTYWANIHNDGSTLPNGVIHVKLDDSLSFVSAAVVPDSINGQNIYWHYDSLFYFSTETVKLKVQMPPFTSMGDTLHSYLTVHQLDAGNNIIYSKTDSLDQVVVCAYDPNDKQVSPIGYGTEGFISQNQELEYLVRFQNTGNDTAITVMIRDQLDDNLDWGTIQPVSYSDPVQISIDQVGEVVFKFENIMLPDSGADFYGSQGYIKYKIQPKSGLAPLTPIYNSANIYFDNNPAVITNFVRSTIECYNTPTPVISYSFPYLNANVSGNYSFQWYLNGNPISGAVTDTLTPIVSGTYTVEILDTNFCYKTSVPYTYYALDIKELAKLKSVVYPNPFSESTTILFDKNLNGEYDLLVYDIVGKEVKHINKIAGNKVEISKRDIGKGLFLAYVVNRTTGEKIFIEKLIVQ